MARGSREAWALGQALVEFAIALPLLLALTFLVTGASEAYRAHQLVDSAAAQASVWAVQNPDADDAKVREYALALAGGSSDASVERLAAGTTDTTASEWRRSGSTYALVTAPARTTYTARRVTVSRSLALPWFGDVTVRSSHTGVASAIGAR